MTEARKLHMVRLNPLVFQTPFSYDRDASITALERVLESHTRGDDLLGGYTHLIKLISAHEYTILRAYMRRGRRGFVSSRIDGVIWEDEAGHTHIEGTVQVDALSFYGYLSIMSILCFFSLVGSRLWTIVPLLVLLGITGLVLLGFYLDRKNALHNLQQRLFIIPERKYSAEG